MVPDPDQTVNQVQYQPSLSWWQDGEHVSLPQTRSSHFHNYKLKLFSQFLINGNCFHHLSLVIFSIKYRNVTSVRPHTKADTTNQCLVQEKQTSEQPEPSSKKYGKTLFLLLILDKRFGMAYLKATNKISHTLVWFARSKIHACNHMKMNLQNGDLPYTKYRKVIYHDQITMTRQIRTWCLKGKIFSKIWNRNLENQNQR